MTAQATATHTPAWHDRPSWRTINITTPERMGRIVLGLAATVAGLVLLFSAGSALAIVLEVLLIAAGFDLVVTGGWGIARSTPASATRPSLCGGRDDRC